MNREKVAEELVELARELTSADTFKCPDCGGKVLEQTKYCVKCKKKVKKAGELLATSEDDLAGAAMAVRDKTYRLLEKEVRMMVKAARKHGDRRLLSNAIDASSALDEALVELNKIVDELF